MPRGGTELCIDVTNTCNCALRSIRKAGNLGSPGKGLSSALPSQENPRKGLLSTNGILVMDKESVPRNGGYIV